MLHVWNPRGGWWGEGDEKFFVDGEKFPSTFGTGSEDYFGYAWGNPHLFAKPYHAQTFTQNNQGHQSLLRLHIVDNVPFEKSFEGCIEKYFKNDRGTLYAATVWWYLAPGGKDPYGPVPVAQRDGYYVRPQPIFAGFKVLNEPHGEPQLQPMASFGKGMWKNDEQLWWTGARPGDELALALPVRRSGKHDLTVHLTKARDYAIVQFFVDGQRAGEPIDLYNPSVIPVGPIALGSFDLSEGQHRLVVKIVGANPAAEKSYMFGIDRVDLAAKNDRQAGPPVWRPQRGLAAFARRSYNRLMPTIEISGLSKSYRVYQKKEGLLAAVRGLFRRQYRIVEAVRGIDLTVEQGEFVAFLGPNGAGKTTTLKAALRRDHAHGRHGPGDGLRSLAARKRLSPPLRPGDGAEEPTLVGPARRTSRSACTSKSIASSRPLSTAPATSWSICSRSASCWGSRSASCRWASG